MPLENDELLRHKRPNPLDMYRGMGPIQALLLELDSQRYGKEWQAQFFQNSARPGGVIEVDKRLDDDEFDEMRDRWDEQHRGLSKAHRVAIIENGAKWIETSFSMRDLQMVELDGAARDKTLVAFGFPKAMLGIVDFPLDIEIWAERLLPDYPPLYYRIEDFGGPVLTMVLRPAA